MDRDEAAADLKWIESIDVSTVGAVTCERTFAVLVDPREWYDETAGEASEPPARRRAA